MRRWFDGHLDLAMLAEEGRNMVLPASECGGPYPPASVCFPSLREGGIVECLGTIFTEADGKGPASYLAGDSSAANAAGARQLRRYHEWAGAGLLDLVDLRGLVIAGGGSAPLKVRILMECADPIRTPGELSWWVERGVCAIGLAWARGSRYAGGNSNAGVGLSDLGKELLREMARLGVVHDLSHLSQKATEDVFEFDAREHVQVRIVASHSNSRAVIGDGRERHITDETIREISRRGGVVGLNLCSAFLGKECWDSGRATTQDCVRHLEHMAEVAGRRDFLALGSDMDGGFSAERLPAGIDLPRDLERLAASLRSVGWSESEVDGFAGGNWARFWHASH